MRLPSAVAMLILGCGRAGFQVCAGCSGDDASSSETIAVTNVVAPGTTRGAPVEISFTQTAGRFVLVGGYLLPFPSIDELMITDTAGTTWGSLPAVGNPCGLAHMRFWYATSSSSSVDMITIKPRIGQPEDLLGAFLVELENVAGVDRSSGNVSSTETLAFDTGPLDVTGDNEHVVALFTIGGSPRSIEPSGELRKLADDDSFSALVADMPANAGTVLPSVTVGPSPTSCWMGSSVSLRPIR